MSISPSFIPKLPSTFSASANLSTANLSWRHEEKGCLRHGKVSPHSNSEVRNSPLPHCSLPFGLWLKKGPGGAFQFSQKSWVEGGRLPLESWWEALKPRVHPDGGAGVATEERMQTELRQKLAIGCRGCESEGILRIMIRFFARVTGW